MLIKINPLIKKGVIFLFYHIFRYVRTNNFPPYFTTDYNVSDTWINGVWYFKVWYNGIGIADCLTEEEVYQKIEEHKEQLKNFPNFVKTI